MIRVPITQAKRSLCARARGVARGGEIVVLTARGRDLAALVPVSLVRLAQEVGRATPSVSVAAAGLKEISEGAAALSERREEGS